MMKNRNFLWLSFVGVLLISLLFEACVDRENKSNRILDENGKEISILQRIKNSGKLIGLVDYNSTNYFIYRGEPMGYQFEMLKAFAAHLNVKLEIITNNSLDESFLSLQKGEVDLIAIGLTKTKERSNVIAFSDPLDQTRQVLVQRKPDNWRKMATMDEIESKLIRNPIQLAGKTIVIQKASSFKTRLQNLSNEIGDTIYIIEDEFRELEQLIAGVADGEIDYTISDEHIALVNQKYYPDIDVKTPVSFPQNIAWGIRIGEEDLRVELNSWIAGFKNTLTARLLYNKYFKNPRSVNIASSEYNSIGGGKISSYDEVVKEISGRYGLDWRFLSSIIYQESGFKQKAKSWMGAYGLMQLMPATAEMFGVDSLSSPAEQIEAGVKFIQWLDKQIPEEITDKDERIKFVLAAYNVGLGHILDARRLAKKYDSDPNIWTNNVDTFLLQKSDPHFYRDSVVRYGYCRGSEPYNFVIEILDRYEHYSNLIKN